MRGGRSGGPFPVRSAGKEWFRSGHSAGNMPGSVMTKPPAGSAAQDGREREKGGNAGPEPSGCGRRFHGGAMRCALLRRGSDGVEKLRGRRAVLAKKDGKAGKRERWTEVVRVRAPVSRRSDTVCSAAERVRWCRKTRGRRVVLAKKDGKAGKRESRARTVRGAWRRFRVRTG